MFESAELGHTVDKERYEREVPALREALLNGGGDVLASGRLQGRPWRVGVRDPRAPDRLLGAIEVEGKKLSVKSEGDVNVEASGKVKVKGSNVGVN